MYKMKPLTYKSPDDYFTITEKIVNNTVVVRYLFSTPIYGIDGFWSESTYNMNGKLIGYNNTVGDSIDRTEQPVTVLTPPRILNGNE